VITDFLDEAQKEILKTRFEGYESGIKPTVVFDTDTVSIKSHATEIWPQNRNERYYDGMNPLVIIGSSYERNLADEFKVPLLTISYPVTNRVVLNRAYAGPNGGLCAVEDLYTLLVSAK